MSYVHTLKRIRTHKTNYRKRQALLVSRQNFVTIKITNQNLIAQILKPEILGDIVKVSAYSRELRTYGWKGSLNSLPACYLAGALLGKKALEKGVYKAVLYIGSKPFTSRIAACMKGIVQAGVNIPISSESFPPEYRLNGQHIADYALKIKSEDIDKYNRNFSSIIREGLVPENYQTHVKEIAALILSEKPHNEHDRENTNVQSPSDPLKGVE
ncbi:MAG TPA: 50S ribosomal protein L18 [Nitrososphaeraceae archaeon]|jgi:large subunit ribosomal protein L18|nr:50S ribosomal protein L18 [Nitrososphaeraceae archaeon]